MDINQIIDMEDEVVKYCVSAFFLDGFILWISAIS